MEGKKFGGKEEKIEGKYMEKKTCRKRKKTWREKKLVGKEKKKTWREEKKKNH